MSSGEAFRPAIPASGSPKSSEIDLEFADFEIRVFGQFVVVERETLVGLAPLERFVDEQPVHRTSVSSAYSEPIPNPSESTNT